MELDLGLLPVGMQMACRPTSPDSDEQSESVADQLKAGPPGLLLPPANACASAPPGILLPAVAPSLEGPPGLSMPQETELYLVKRKVSHPDRDSLARENAALAEANERLARENAQLKMEARASAAQMFKPKQTFFHVNSDQEASAHHFAQGPPGVWFSEQADLLAASGWSLLSEVEVPADQFSASDDCPSWGRPRRAKSMSMETFCSDATTTTGSFSTTASSFCELDFEQTLSATAPPVHDDWWPTYGSVAHHMRAEIGPPGIFFTDEQVRVADSSSCVAFVDAPWTLNMAAMVQREQPATVVEPEVAEVSKADVLPEPVPEAEPEAAFEEKFEPVPEKPSQPQAVFKKKLEAETRGSVREELEAVLEKKTEAMFEGLGGSEAVLKKKLEAEARGAVREKLEAALAKKSEAVLEKKPEAVLEAPRKPQPSPRPRIERSRVSAESLAFEVPPPRQPRVPCSGVQPKTQPPAKPSKKARKAVRDAGRVTPNDVAVGCGAFGAAIAAPKAAFTEHLAFGRCSRLGDSDRFGFDQAIPDFRVPDHSNSRVGKVKVKVQNHETFAVRTQVSSTCTTEGARRANPPKARPWFSNGIQRWWLLLFVGFLLTILSSPASICVLCTYARESLRCGTRPKSSSIVGSFGAWSAVTPKQGALLTRDRSVASVIQSLSVEVARAAVISESVLDRLSERSTGIA